MGLPHDAVFAATRTLAIFDRRAQARAKAWSERLGTTVVDGVLVVWG